MSMSLWSCRILPLVLLLAACPGESTRRPADQGQAQPDLPKAVADGPGPKDTAPVGDMFCQPTAVTLTFNPTADAYVDQGQPTTNFGTTAKLQIDESPDQHAYLLFDVKGAGTVTSAKLRFYVVNGSSNGPAVHTTSTNWQESAITWDNKPPPGTLITDLGSVSTGWQEVDVSSTVSADGAYAFAMVPTSSDGCDFDAREGDTPPELVVVTTQCKVVIPEAGLPDKGPGPADTGPATDIPTTVGFRFVAWADTKNSTDDLSTLSDQVAALKPVLTIYPGDMVDTWSSGAMDTWKQAADGQLTGDTSPNGIFNITFTARGNHDDSTSGYDSWMAANHPLATAAAAIGATSFTSMTGQVNRTYSFDYKNAHFVGIDVLGSVGSISSAQVSWLDTDLTAAEGRGVQHSFVFFHGPIYCVDGHCSCSTGICSTSSEVNALINVLNKHSSVSATFHGHEHVYTYTYLDSSRDSRITRPFHQFVTGSAGAGPSSCSKPGRYSYCLSSNGFATVDVTGLTVVVSIYKKGVAQPDKVVSYTWK